MGLVGAGRGSTDTPTDTLYGTRYDSGAAGMRLAHVMVGECRWPWRSGVCFLGDTSMFVR